MCPQSSLSRHGLLLGVAALFAPACMPAPGPSYPAHGTLEIGADYRDRAVNRWVCDSAGSVVLADTGKGFVLHLESYDWVMTGEDGGAVVTFGGAVEYQASKSKGGDLVIRRASSQGVAEEKCAVR